MAFIKLFETYKSQKELEYLAKIVLHRIAEKTFEKLESQFSKIKYFEGIQLNNFNPNVFEELEKFIIKWGDMRINIINPNNIEGFVFKSQAVYIPSDDNGNKYIFMQETKYPIKKANEYLEKWDYENDNDIVDDISDLLHREYGSDLIHELQHAYDDYRSGGKATYQSDEYNMNKDEYRKLNMIGIENMKEEERELFAKYYKEYLNLKHEVDARFAQVVQDIDFNEWDLDESEKQNKDVYIMKPFDEVYRKLKYKQWFKFLSDKDKKRLQKKLGQYYQFEKELVDKMNAESIDYDERKKNGEFGGIK